MARDWSDGLNKVVRHSAIEAAVGQHTQLEPDSLWNLEPVQFTEQSSRTAVFRTGWSRCSRISGAPAITKLQESSLLMISDRSMVSMAGRGREWRMLRIWHSMAKHVRTVVVT